MAALGTEIKNRTARMMGGGAAASQYIPAYKGDKDRRKLSAESKQALIVGGVGLALFVFGMFALSSFFAAEERGHIPLQLHKEVGDVRAPHVGHHTEYDPHHHHHEDASSIHYEGHHHDHEHEHWNHDHKGTYLPHRAARPAARVIRP